MASRLVDDLLQLVPFECLRFRLLLIDILIINLLIVIQFIMVHLRAKTLPETERRPVQFYRRRQCRRGFGSIRARPAGSTGFAR